MQSGDLTWGAISRPVLEKTTYFRPLVFLTYFYEVKFFGLNPGSAHLNNLIIFLLNVCLAYFLSGEIFKRLGIVNLDWMVVLLYAFHPVLVESNAWLAGRFDLMVTTFMFLSLYLYLKMDASIKRDFFLALSLLLGLLSKEMAITVPLLIVILYLISNPGFGLWEAVINFAKNNKRLICFYACVIIFYFSLRYASVGGVYHFKEASEASQGYGLFYPVYTLAFYLHQMLIPFFDINPQHNATLELEKGYQNYFTYFFVGFYLIVLALGALKNRSWAWVGLLGMISLSPVLNIIPMTIGGNIGHERFLAAPLLFFLIFIVCAFSVVVRLLAGKILLKVALTILGGSFVIGSIFTTSSVIPIWRTNYTLWAWMYQKTPAIDYVSTAYFLALLEDKRFEEFEREYEKILEDKDNITPAQMVFYSTYLLEQRSPLAAKSIETAIDLVKKKLNEKKNNVLGSINAASGMLYFLYIDKALALATIDGDVKSALEASLTADAWKSADSSPNYEALWHRLAYFYALDDLENARKLYLEIKNFSNVGGKNLMHSYFDVVYRHCLRHHKEDDIFCQEKARNSINHFYP
ncbi:hypothetical protein ACDW_42390 [Acidovorax sp. DW039]|uniref:hypothetical protein n=1 Tax=Acidovorax sp. DW039 TaxID=3095606 RepID=UPI0030887417|nr:hypothetical protein ACDW_42390 [Acidovorax sp. DW039]